MTQTLVPDFLSHYYERARGPFRSLTNLAPTEAEALLDQLRQEGDVFASKRSADYLTIRRELEQRVRALFIHKGGAPKRRSPHYMILGACPWLLEWYREGCELRAPLAMFDRSVVSFTYGDTFPAMRYQDGKPYRGQVYTLDELPSLVAAYGLPQDWNRDGKLAPERYIEAQVWDDLPLGRYLC